MSAAQKVDWGKVEPHYRAGLRTFKDMGAEFGVTPAAILKHARKEGWSRDLKAKIAAAAEAKVNEALVNDPVNDGSPFTERAIVEANADAIVKVRLAHRSDIRKARTLAMQLMAELETQCDSAPLYEELLDLVIPASEDEDSKASQDRVLKLRQAFDKAMSLGGRTKTMKDLADTLKTLVALEREAFNVGEAPPLSTEGEAVDIPALARRIAFAFSASTRTIQ